MKILFAFLLLAAPLMAQSGPLNGTNVKLTTVPAQATASSVPTFFGLTAGGLGQTATPTVAWSAIVLTNTVDTADIFDGTTAGRNIFKLPNPSAITFLRINADNTVTARSAADFKTDLSLNNVDNTSDANKPVSTAQQTALDLKANLAGAAFTGAISTTTSLTVGSGGPAITKFLTNTAALDFAAIGGTVFREDKTITVTGAALGDVVSLGVPHGSVPAIADEGHAFFAWVSATDTVTVRHVVTNSGATADPASGTFRVMVTKF